ncbi:Peptide methionine sulfoxide reductase MsrA [Sesbania bispinosa]|nr:Peptide methionine sulfoxide reductase MsrA [Sesbania bispinosa]
MFSQHSSSSLRSSSTMPLHQVPGSGPTTHPRRNPINSTCKLPSSPLGSFWRSEAVFRVLARRHFVTTVGYAGGSKPNPEYRSLGDHAASPFQVEYDPRLISFRELLDVFWSSHDSRQVYGQGPDVGNQYRSIIFVNGTEESRMAAVSKNRNKPGQEAAL